MSDYTPTTEQVRGGFAASPMAHEPREYAEAEFDAWIAQHDAEIRTAALNAAADDVPQSTPPLGGQLAISEPVRMRFQQWLREQAGGAASNPVEFDAQHDREVRAAALEEAAAKIESKRSLLGIASRALDIGQAWSAALIRDEAKRLRGGGVA